MRPVGHVRVVAGVLDDDGLGPGTVLPHLAPLDGEADAPLFALAGKLYVYLFLRFAACQRPRGGLGGGGGAGSGGPATPELLALDPLHARRHGGFMYLAAGRHRVPLSLPLGLAERVGELRMVQVRARPARAQPRSYEDERLAGKARLADPVGEFVQRTLDDYLIGPARLVDDGAWGVRSVTTPHKLLLQEARARGGEEDRHGGAMSGEAIYVLALRHRGAAGTAGQDDALGELPHPELAPYGCRRRPQRRDAGDYLPG